MVKLSDTHVITFSSRKMALTIHLLSLRRVEIQSTRTNSRIRSVHSKYPMRLFNAVVNPRLKIVRELVKKLKYCARYWSLPTLNWNLLSVIRKYCFTSKIKNKFRVNRDNLLFSTWKIKLDGFKRILKIGPLKLTIIDCQCSENQDWTRSNTSIDKVKIKEVKFKNYRMLV